MPPSPPAAHSQSGEPQRLLTVPRILLHLGLFLLTFFTALVAGVQWGYRDPFELSNLRYGIEYASALMFFLTAHEFGHYLAARVHGVAATLPYYIPFPPNPFVINFGTLGAVIRTRSPIPSRKAMFDIGAAGPIAGFVVSIGLLVYGFLNLPGPDFILQIHPDFDFPSGGSSDPNSIQLEFGPTLLYQFLSTVLTNPAREFVPPMSEMYHYPFLCVGWFGLFVTAMNLMPIGQFDGGHIIYTMFGRLQAKISFIAFGVLLLLGLPAVLDGILRTLLNQSETQLVPLAQYSWVGWFLWALISYFFVKLEHPPLEDETPLDPARLLIGWLTMAIFIFSFSLVPFAISF